MISALTVALVGLALFFAGRLFLKGRQLQPQATVANTRPAPRAPQPTTVAQTVSGQAAQTGAQPAVSVDQLNNTSTSSSVSSGKVPNPGQSATGLLANKLPESSEKSATAKNASVKLQGIFFHPTKPAAMISGNTVYIGDQIGKWRVVAIDQHTATLAGGGVTNILKLPKQY
jgi:hypothetical protein